MQNKMFFTSEWPKLKYRNLNFLNTGLRFIFVVNIDFHCNINITNFSGHFLTINGKLTIIKDEMGNIHVTNLKNCLMCIPVGVDINCN